VDLAATEIARSHHTGPPPPVVLSPRPSPAARRRLALAPVLGGSVLALGLVVAATPSGARAVAGAPAAIGTLTALALLAGLLPNLAPPARWSPRSASAAAGEVERRVPGPRPTAMTAAEAAQPFAFAVVLGWGTAAGILVTAAVSCAVALSAGGRLRAGLLGAARLVVATAAGGALWSALGDPGAIAAAATAPAAATAADLAALAGALAAVVLVRAALAPLAAVGTAVPSPRGRRRRESTTSGSGRVRASWWTEASTWAAVALVAVAPVAWVVAARQPALTPLLLAPAVALSLVAGALVGRRRLDEVVERERARAEAGAEAILATVSHELRAPLAVVLGSLETLSARDGELTAEERRELVAMATRQGQRLKRLAAQLLLAARLEQAEEQRDGDAVADAIRVVGEAERAMELLHPGRQVRLDASANALVVLAVPETVLQVLTNLLDNAAKYSPPGTPIGVRARRVGSSAVITVSDSGPGVPPEQRERIFERFTQLGSDHDHRGDGVGLGLYIARELARSVGGDLILCRDAPEGHRAHDGWDGRDGRDGRDGAGGAVALGACFELRLPLAGDDLGPVLPRAGRGQAAPGERPAAPVGSVRRQ
jgi:signal transduction histidine kinase